MATWWVPVPTLFMSSGLLISMRSFLGVSDDAKRTHCARGRVLLWPTQVRCPRGRTAMRDARCTRVEALGDACTERREAGCAATMVCASCRCRSSASRARRWTGGEWCPRGDGLRCALMCQCKSSWGFVRRGWRLGSEGMSDVETMGTPRGCAGFHLLGGECAPSRSRATHFPYLLAAGFCRVIPAKVGAAQEGTSFSIFVFLSPKSCSSPPRKKKRTFVRVGGGVGRQGRFPRASLVMGGARPRRVPWWLRTARVLWSRGEVVVVVGEDGGRGRRRRA
jgi:hypothetical protein